MTIYRINPFATPQQFSWNNDEESVEFELPTFENPFVIEEEVQVFETQIVNSQKETNVEDLDKRVNKFAEDFLDREKLWLETKSKKNTENNNNNTSWVKNKKIASSTKEVDASRKDEVVETSKRKNSENFWTLAEDNEFKKYLNEGRPRILQKEISIKGWIAKFKSETFPPRTFQSYLSRYTNLYINENFDHLNTTQKQNKSDIEVNESSPWLRGNAPTEDSWTLSEEQHFITFLKSGREFVIANKCYIKDWIGNYIPDTSFRGRTYSSYFAKYHILKNQGRVVALNSNGERLIADSKLLPWSEEESEKLFKSLISYQKDEVELDIVLYKKIGIEMGRSYEMIQEQAGKLAEKNPELKIQSTALQRKKSRKWSTTEEDEFCEHMEKGREALSANKCTLKDWVENYRSSGLRTQLALIVKYRDFIEAKKIQPLERNVDSFSKEIPWTFEEDLKLIDEIKKNRSLCESRDNNITMTDLYKIIGTNIGRHHELVEKKYKELIKKNPDLKIAVTKNNGFISAQKKGLTDDEKNFLSKILQEVKQENENLNQLNTAKIMRTKWDAFPNKTRDISVEQIRGFLRSKKN